MSTAADRTQASLRADFTGGLTAAIIALPMAIAFGVMVFAPLGEGYASRGALAGLYGAIFTGFFAAMLGGTPVQVTGPTGPMAVVMSALVAHLTSLSDNPEHVMLLVFLCVGMAGCLQMGLGLLRLGGLIKYIPYPVIAGFMNGIAVLIFLSQAPRLLGVTALPHWADWQAATLGVGLISIAAMVWVPRWTPGIPGALCSLVVGTGAYYLCARLLPELPLGPTLGQIPGGLPHPSTLAQLHSNNLLKELPGLLPSALALGLLGSIDSLLTSVVADAVTRTRHNSNRELFGQGVGNVMACLFGGLGGAGATVRTLVNVNAGGRTRYSGMFHSLILLLIVALLAPLAGALPLVVLAGILMVTAVTMIDQWSRGLLFKLIGTARQKREIAINLVVVGLVMVVTVAVDLMIAVLVGVVLTCLLFVEKMGRTVVSRVYYGNERFSNHWRTDQQKEILTRFGDETAVLELQGPLFFGSADQLGDVVRGEQAAQVVILDLRRVDEIDATGARILQLIQEQLTDQGKVLLLANLVAGQAKWELLEDLGVLATIGKDYCLSDADRALEWAEGRVLAAHGLEEVAYEQQAWQANMLCRNLSGSELEVLGQILERLEFGAGDLILKRGEVGDAVYLQTSGLTSITLQLGDQRRKRTMAYGAGAFFGGMSLLGGKPRAADVHAERPTELYRLSRAALEQLLEEHPPLGLKIVWNLGRELSERLRSAQSEIQLLDR